MALGTSTSEVEDVPLIVFLMSVAMVDKRKVSH